MKKLIYIILIVAALVIAGKYIKNKQVQEELNEYESIIITESDGDIVETRMYDENIDDEQDEEEEEEFDNSDLVDDSIEYEEETIIEE